MKDLEAALGNEAEAGEPPKRNVARPV